MRRGDAYFALFTAAFVLSMSLLASHSPGQNEYHLGADEGTYLRQGLAVLEGGPGAFRNLAAAYLGNPSLQAFPPPSRVGHILTAAAALSFRHDVAALSWLSLLCFAATCVVLYLGVRRIWDDRVAAYVGVLACASPLGGGMARRALLDSDYALFTIAAFLAFLAFVANPSRRRFVLFAALLFWSLLVKETAAFFIPFYAGILLVARWRGRRAVTGTHIALTALAIPAVAALVGSIAVGGAGQLAAILRVCAATNSEPGGYAMTFGGGPWFEYLLDFMLLSPIVVLLFVGLAGHSVMANASRATWAAIGVVAWWVLVAAFLPKNPRFALPIEFVIRLGAGVFVAVLSDRLPAPRWRGVAGSVAIVGLAMLDAGALNRHFVSGRTYDPVAANLLTTERIVPASSSNRVPASIAALANAALEQPSPERFLELSVAYYAAGDFTACVLASEKALALRPEFAPAWNNIGSAYIETGHIREAIAALETAVQLDPSNERARNNLTWAHQKATQVQTAPAGR